MSNFKSGERRMPALMVELVGAAGVGKTFLLGRLVEALRARGLTATDLREITTWNFSLLSMAALGRAAASIMLIKPVLLLSYPRAVRKLAGYVMQRRLADGSVGLQLSCDGLFQKIRGLYRHAGEVRMEFVAERLLRDIRPPHVVIVVEASASTIYERRTRRARAGDAFNRESVAMDVQLVQQTVNTIMHIRESIAPELRMFRVDVETSEIADIAEGIADELEAMLNHQSAA